MKIAETSMAAYIGNVKQFESQGEHIDFVVGEHPEGLTHGEVWNIIRAAYPETLRHNVNARLSDLRMDGRVYVSGQRKCNMSEELCKVWNRVPEQQQEQFKKEAMQSFINNLKEGIKDKQERLEKAEKKLAAMGGHNGDVVSS